MFSVTCLSSHGLQEHRRHRLFTKAVEPWVPQSPRRERRTHESVCSLKVDGVAPNWPVTRMPRLGREGKGALCRLAECGSAGVETITYGIRFRTDRQCNISTSTMIEVFEIGPSVGRRAVPAGTRVRATARCVGDVHLQGMCGPPPRTIVDPSRSCRRSSPPRPRPGPQRSCGGLARVPGRRYGVS